MADNENNDFKEPSLRTMSSDTPTDILGAVVENDKRSVAKKKEFIHKNKEVLKREAALKNRVRKFENNPKVDLSKTGEDLKIEQEKIIEKRNIEEESKKLSIEKELLKGLNVYNVKEDTDTPKKSFYTKNVILSISILFIILIGGLIVLKVSTDNVDRAPGAINQKVLEKVDDVLFPEKEFAVNIDSIVNWNPLEYVDEDGVLSKISLYKKSAEGPKYLSIEEVLSFYDLKFPDGLSESLGEYYFIGTYGDEEPLTFVIFSVDSYNNAVAWMINWEENLINALDSLFGDLISNSNVNSTTVKSSNLSNILIKTLSNTKSKNDLHYYFYGRSLLIFAVGDINSILKINSRIDLANIDLY